MTDIRPPDELDRLAESNRLAWKEIERLKTQVEALSAVVTDQGRRARQAWAKQGETNKRFDSDLRAHRHAATDVPGIDAGTALFPVEEVAL
jgi:hypothetical protein